LLGNAFVYNAYTYVPGNTRAFGRADLPRPDKRCSRTQLECALAADGLQLRAVLPLLRLLELTANSVASILCSSCERTARSSSCAEGNPPWALAQEVTITVLQCAERSVDRFYLLLDQFPVLLSLRAGSLVEPSSVESVPQSIPPAETVSLQLLGAQLLTPSQASRKRPYPEPAKEAPASAAQPAPPVPEQEDWSAFIRPGTVPPDTSEQETTAIFFVADACHSQRMPTKLWRARFKTKKIRIDLLLRRLHSPPHLRRKLPRRAPRSLRNRRKRCASLRDQSS
jgi:hypothetical protein